MSKSRWLVATVLVLAIFTAARGALGFFLGAVLVGVPYAISCMLNPRTIHRRCEGRGYHKSALFPWATRKCRGCQGGLQVRHGARAVGLPHIRAEHQARTRAIARNREGRTWR